MRAKRTSGTGDTIQQGSTDQSTGQGFTLIELLVVLRIIAVLLAI